LTHYFDNPKNLPSNRKEITFRFLDIDATFVSDTGIFSKKEADEGSLYLAEEAIKLELKGSLLDMGCGYGLIGLLIKLKLSEIKLSGVDVNPRAIECAQASALKMNLDAQFDCLDAQTDLTGQYDTIVMNPPIRAGKAVIYRLYENAQQHLVKHGRLIIVIRRQQGAASSLAYLQTIFSEVKRLRLKRGYEVIQAVKD
jgi:16S rRNA (guanine1207-N2)-methyltransferase